ncbi:MAG: LacI family DNA-binding transcriptional regulator [Victivallis sp.]
MKKVTVRMVGAAAGVSHATVSRVLNNDPRVHPSTRLAVIRAAQQLGYRLESGGGRKTIALILPNAVAGGYMGHMLMQIRAEISSRGYHTELVSPSDIGILNDRVISGGISLAIDNDQEAWEELKTLPLVKVNQTGNHLNRIYACARTEFEAMDLAVEYLAARGHRRIAYLSDVAEERDRGLLRAGTTASSPPCGGSAGPTRTGSCISSPGMSCRISSRSKNRGSPRSSAPER